MLCPPVMSDFLQEKEEDTWNMRLAREDKKYTTFFQFS